MTFTVPRQTLTLPLELVEIIIDFLSPDPKALRKACLVSRAWVPICRTHLFRRIVLHWCDNGVRRSNSLFSLLTHTPFIANYIRELSIHEGLISNHSRITFCFAHSLSLPKLLYCLPHLRLLEFRASALTHWSELSTELVHAVSHVATCSALDELILGSWNFSSQPKALDALLTAAAKNVKILALTDIVTPLVPEGYPGVVGPDDEVPGVVGVWFPSEELTLKSLSINDGAASMVPFCAHWFYMRPSARVRSLQLSCATHQSNISDLLRVLGESLEHLELDIRALHGERPLDLRRNTRLQSLHLRASEYPLMLYQNSVTASWIVDVLTTLRCFEYLELLCVNFGVDADRLRRQSQSDSACWRHLDQILSPKRYIHLRTVQVGIKFHCHNGSEYMKETRQSMPSLCHAGILDIYTETRRFCCVDYY